jgi:hypothetical protein
MILGVILSIILGVTSATNLAGIMVEIIPRSFPDSSQMNLEVEAARNVNNFAQYIALCILQN